MQRLSHLSPDGQVNSISVLCTQCCVHVYCYVLSIVYTCTAMNKQNIALSVAPSLMERSYRSIPSGIRRHIQSDIENCEGWLSPGGHSSGGRALTAKVRGPGSILGGCRFFRSSLKIFPSLFTCTQYSLPHTHVSPCTVSCAES